MADYADVYADGMGVSVGPFGLTVTFQLSQPTMEPGPHIDPSTIVCRVRISPDPPSPWVDSRSGTAQQVPC